MDWRAMGIFALLLALPFAQATGMDDDSYGRLMSAAAKEAKCKADFMKEYALKVKGASEDNSIGSLGDDLSDDADELEKSSKGGDSGKFSNDMRNRFDERMRKAKDAIARAKVVVKEKREALKEQHRLLKGKYDGCRNEAVKDFTNARVNSYGAHLQRYDKQIETLSGKGINTAGLSAILSDAKAQIVGPLRAALGNATNGSDVSDAIHKYCLYDGCRNGTNFHLEAKFDIEKLQRTVDYLNSKNISDASKAKLANASAYLSGAKDALAEVGSAQYTKESKGEVWGAIRDASRAIKEALSSSRRSG